MLPHLNEGALTIMLILTRRVGEAVMIGEEVTVTVLGVKGNQVRIGVNAPKTVSVHREEIFERIKNEQNERKRPQRPETAAKGVWPRSRAIAFTPRHPVSIIPRLPKGRRRVFPARSARGELAEWSKAHPC